MKKLIVVADWAADSLACQEVRTAVEGFLENPATPNITFISSTTSTVHTGFIINQLVETEERFGRPLDTVIFQSSDPVVEQVGLEKSWSEFLIARTRSGIHVIGSNAGLSYTFVKPKIEEVFHYPGLEMTGSFRARDVFARMAAHMMDSKQDDLDLEEMHSNIIRETDRTYIGHIDSFGNIITTIKESALKGKYEYGNEVAVSLGDLTQKAVYSRHLFAGEQHNLIMYPGTFGSSEDPYLEISMYANLAEKLPRTGITMFNNPKPGMQVIIA